MCAVGNQLVMERDWVPTLAGDHTRPRLHVLNARMRRIDLVSKILAPVAASVVAIRASSAGLALAVAGLNVGTVAAEYIAARMAWERCQCLRMERGDAKIVAGEEVEVEEGRGEEEGKGLRLYFGSDVCLREFSRNVLLLGWVSDIQQLPFHLLCSPSQSSPSQAR